VYKDATTQFSQFHPTYVTKLMLLKYCIGELDKKELPFLISNSPLSLDFALLDAHFRAKGYFENENTFYIKELLKCALLISLSIYLVLFGQETFLNYFFASFLLAFGWHQLAFVGHDTGHNGVSGNNSKDHFLGIIVGSLIGGISIGWWKDSHYVHHVITNDPEHDPDIQHLPFLAVSIRLFENLFSTYHKKILKFDFLAKIFVRIQHYTYYILMMFGRFNLYVQSLNFIFLNRRCRWRYLEIPCFLTFFFWYILLVSYISGFWNKLIFIFGSHAISAVLHVQITISHFAMDTEVTNNNEEFFRHQLRTTMDVDCPEWLDWLHGGLQFQVIHHLFPRMPRRFYRSARKDVIKLCEKYGVKYHSYSFVTGNITVLTHLKKISEKIKL